MAWVLREVWHLSPTHPWGVLAHLVERAEILFLPHALSPPIHGRECSSQVQTQECGQIVKTISSPGNADSYSIQGWKREWLLTDSKLLSSRCHTIHLGTAHFTERVHRKLVEWINGISWHYGIWEQRTTWCTIGRGGGKEGRGEKSRNPLCWNKSWLWANLSNRIWDRTDLDRDFGTYKPFELAFLLIKKESCPCCSRGPTTPWCTSPTTPPFSRLLSLPLSYAVCFCLQPGSFLTVFKDTIQTPTWKKKDLPDPTSLQPSCCSLSYNRNPLKVTHHSDQSFPWLQSVFIKVINDLHLAESSSQYSAHPTETLLKLISPKVCDPHSIAWSQCREMLDDLEISFPSLSYQPQNHVWPWS